jgi:hypothetical protein
MSVTDNYNLPLPDPSAASAKADVQKIRDALIALDDALANQNVDAYTKSEVDSAIAQAKADSKTETKNELLGGAGPAHDTLQELAAELADDENAITGLTNLVSQKADLSDLTGNTVPIGAIIDFPVDAVPLGFLPCLGATFDELVYPELYTYLGTNVLPDYGDRVRRGKGTLAGNVGDTQEDAFQGHFHSHVKGWNSSSWHPGNCSAGGGRLDTGTNNDCGVGTDSVIGATSDGVNGTPRTASETRVKSGIILPCIKAYSSFTSQGTANLAAMEQAINNAVLASGVQVFGDGGAQVRANIGAISSAKPSAIASRSLPSGTSGGAGVANVFTDVDLNKEDYDPEGLISINNGAITFAVAGYVSWKTNQHYACAGVRSQFYCVDDSEIVGNSNYTLVSTVGHGSPCTVGYAFVEAGKTYKTKIRANTAYAHGLGVSASHPGLDERYTELFFYKMGD